MDRMNAGPFAPSIHTATTSELSHVAHAEVRVENGIVFDEDNTRAAHLGQLMKLPSLGEVLLAWSKRIELDECVDYALPFNALRLGGSGKLGSVVDGKLGTLPPMPLTYRTFGNTLRHYCAPPRNVAACLIKLGVKADGSHSPRACAFNDYLTQRNERELAHRDLTGNEPATCVIRTRKLGAGTSEQKVRTAIAIVSPDHCLGGGDDSALIAAIALAFGGNTGTARASAWRGVEESEIRVLFPAAEVKLPGDPEVWCGYLTAKNSETGAKSWSISAGLYRKADGMTVACEALIKTGRHVGRRVPERMVEVAEGAKELLAKLIAEGATMAAQVAPWKLDNTVDRLGRALSGLTAVDPELRCAIAFELGRLLGDRTEVTVGDLIQVLGYCASRFERRVDARPIEVLLGRVMVKGWVEFVAVQGEGELAEEV